MDTWQVVTLAVVGVVWLWFLVGQYGGSLVSAVRLPWSKGKEITPEQALAALILLKNYYSQQENDIGLEYIENASRELLS